MLIKFIKFLDSVFRDFLVFGGLASLGYGFYMFKPWLGFVVVGGTTMFLGLGWLMRRPK